MNAKKSLVSAAVLFALIGTHATVKDAAASGKIPRQSTDVASKRVVVHSPQGGVLYDQMLNFTGAGALSVDFDHAPTHDFDSYDSNGADDFVVTDPAGWTVTAFNIRAFNAFENPALPSDPIGVTVTLSVYPDNDGAPATAPICSSPQSTSSFDQGAATASIALNEPCRLPQGTYWVALAFDALVQEDTRYWGTVSNTSNSGALWRNPGGLFGECPTYTPLDSCFPAVQVGSDLAFQVVGVIGTGGGECDAGGICLDVTLAPADPDNPALCGTATSLSVDVGDQVNVCYTVTNRSGFAMNYQTLTDNIQGTLFSLIPQPIADASTFQYNRTITVGNSATMSSTWTAQDAQPHYAPQFTPGAGGVTDRVFCDGFDGTACSGGDGSGFIDISQTGAQLDDSEFNFLGFGSVAMPFSFTFYGNTTNALCITTNGGIVVGASSCAIDSSNDNLPSFSVTGAGMLPLWDGFDVTAGHVYTETIGDTPGSRQFVVEWYNRVHFDGTQNTDGATFEVVIDEASGRFSFLYDDVDYTAFGNTTQDPDDCSDGVCATIGLQADSFDGSASDTYSVDFSSIADHSRIDWMPLAPHIFMSTATVTISAGAPIVAVIPTSLSGTAIEGGSTTLPLTIINFGDHDLIWSLLQAPDTDAMAPPRYMAPAPAGTAERVLTLNTPRVLAQGAKRIPQNASHLPLGTPSVPAFAQLANASGGGDYDTFDVASPNTFTPVLANFPQAPFYKSATFVAQDFSKQYMASTDPVTGNIATVSTTDGTITPLPQSGPPTISGEAWWGLKYDNWTSTLYGLGCNTAAQPFTCHLYTIDPGNGATTAGPALTGFEDPTFGVLLIDIAIDPSGQMYGVDAIGGNLVRINKTTGTGHVVGPTGLIPAFAQSIDFDQSTGTLYWPEFDGFFAGMTTIDLNSGATGGFTLLPAETWAFSIATSGGVCASPSTVPWISFDLSSGTTAPTATSAVNVTLNAADLAPGVYTADVCVLSNDRARHLLPVPVEFTVDAPSNMH